MHFTRRSLLLSLPAGLAAASRLPRSTTPPTPYGALPSQRQIAWSSLEYYNFVHFTINTFTDKEWGDGDEPTSIFNPTDFDADALVEILKASGSKGVILTCKHHDGFCLWPTKTTERCIRNTPYRNGKGDIVRELSQAAARHGLKFGVYISPWDRSLAAYGTPAYIDIYRRQLRELLDGYGPIFEIWHDGANGGSGYYGGARGVRTIDKHTYYDWPATWALERRLQPGAALFSDVGPDVRWVGSETGVAGQPCWATFTPRSHEGGPGVPGDVLEAESTSGIPNGEVWMPAECDVSIRPGWFWHESENAKVKTPAELLNLYFESVGRGTSLLLNVPPDRRGRIHETDAAALRTFGASLETIFKSDLAKAARPEASNTRGNDAAYSPSNLIDGNAETYWSTGDAVKNPSATLTFANPATFNLIRVREHIRLGQRVRSFAIDAETGGAWTTVAEGTSIGICRILKLPQALTATRIRLRITGAAACPAISELALFAMHA